MTALLLWLLALTPGPATRAQAPRETLLPFTGLRDLPDYLIVATWYGWGDRDKARREIRGWRRNDIERAIAALRKMQDRLRAVPVQPGDVDFRTVEAAVLMHAEAGLAFLQALNYERADTHLRASVTLYEWSSGAAAERREDGASAAARSPRLLPGPGRRVARRRRPVPGRSRSRRRRAWPRRSTPRSSSCPAAWPPASPMRTSFKHRDSEAAREREAAEKALRDALALDPGLQEARLRLGKLLLDEQRAVEAEAPLAEVDERGVDDRQRYLARLFLGRVADRRGRPEEAARLYGRALEAWPDSQAARFAICHAAEKSSGPAAARPLVAATLAASRRPDRAADPWWTWFFGPPGLAKAALDRAWKALDR